VLLTHAPILVGLLLLSSWGRALRGGATSLCRVSGRSLTASVPTSGSNASGRCPYSGDVREVADRGVSNVKERKCLSTRGIEFIVPCGHLLTLSRCHAP
jgi:hypothetical protein